MSKYESRHDLPGFSDPEFPDFLGIIEEAHQKARIKFRTEDLFDLFNSNSIEKQNLINDIIEFDDNLKESLFDIAINEAAIQARYSNNSHFHSIVDKAVRDYAEYGVVQGTDNWSES